MGQYDILPNTCTISITPFKVNIPDEDVEELKTLLRHSKIAPRTYESTFTNGRYGVSHEWLTHAKKVWLDDYDWKTHQTHLNSYPQFTTSIDGFTIHFAALFSTRADAIPIFLFHGWPGSYMEFLPLFSLMKEKYPSPDSLPYHLIAPSLPGYAFSSGPPLDKEFTFPEACHLFYLLAQGMGFKKILVQGGDVGSNFARIMGYKYAEVIGVHLNFCFLASPPKSYDKASFDDVERKGIEQMEYFAKLGSAYAYEQSTRAATISFALSSTPLALLAWVGEKFLEWQDSESPHEGEPPVNLDEILTSVSLYWFTNTISRSFWPYRENTTPGNTESEDFPEWHLDDSTPVGFTWFPGEIYPVPRAWIEKTADNIVGFWRHDSGGHFGALERPKGFMRDLEEFARLTWK
jgi:microsomal epoxide hydrolase